MGLKEYVIAGAMLATSLFGTITKGYDIKELKCTGNNQVMTYNKNADKIILGPSYRTENGTYKCIEGKITKEDTVNKVIENNYKVNNKINSSTTEATISEVILAKNPELENNYTKLNNEIKKVCKPLLEKLSDEEKKRKKNIGEKIAEKLGLNKVFDYDPTCNAITMRINKKYNKKLKHMELTSKKSNRVYVTLRDISDLESRIENLEEDVKYLNEVVNDNYANIENNWDDIDSLKDDVHENKTSINEFKKYNTAIINDSKEARDYIKFVDDCQEPSLNKFVNNECRIQSITDKLSNYQKCLDDNQKSRDKKYLNECDLDLKEIKNIDKTLLDEEDKKNLKYEKNELIKFKNNFDQKSKEYNKLVVQIGSNIDSIEADQIRAKNKEYEQTSEEFKKLSEKFEGYIKNIEDITEDPIRMIYPVKTDYEKGTKVKLKGGYSSENKVHAGVDINKIVYSTEITDNKGFGFGVSIGGSFEGYQTKTLKKETKKGNIYTKQESSANPIDVGLYIKTDAGYVNNDFKINGYITAGGNYNLNVNDKQLSKGYIINKDGKYTQINVGKPEGVKSKGALIKGTLGAEIEYNGFGAFGEFSLDSNKNKDTKAGLFYKINF